MVFSDGIGAPHFAHHLHLVAVKLTREVIADCLPRIAAVIASEYLVGCEIEAFVVVRTDNQRSIPVPTVGGFVFSGLRLYGHALAALLVVAHQPPVLGLTVDDVLVFGINLRFEAIASIGNEPVGVHDAVLASGARRTALRVVVLGSTVNIVEGQRIVNGNLVELGDGKVRVVLPILGCVEGFVESAVATNEPMLGVLWIDPHAVVVDVLALLPGHFEGFATVLGVLQPGIHAIHGVDIMRMANDLLVVVATGLKARHFCPALTAIAGSVESSIFGCRDNCVNDVRVRRRDIEANAAHIVGWKSVRELLPVCTTVG